MKFKSVSDLQKAIDAYFADCDPHMEEVEEWVQARDKDGKLKKDSNGLTYLVKVKHKVMTKQVPYTITGLALSLGTSRETLLDYEARDKYSDTIKRAKLRCQHFAEQMLYTPSPTGAIFNLKNNYNWVDKQEVDGEQKVVIETRKGRGKK